MIGPVALIAALAVASPEPIDLISWFSDDDFPMAAMKEGLEGRSYYQVEVGGQGEPLHCRIVKSSGHAVLDKATCDAIMSRARFRIPSAATRGKRDSIFSGLVSWQMPTSTADAHRAIIVDFGAAGTTPNCQVVAVVMRANEGPSCASVLGQADFMKELSQQFRRVIWLVAAASGRTPYRGDPSWGDRVSFLASEQIYVKGSFPSACRTIAAEGWDAGKDACEGFPQRTRTHRGRA